MADNGTIDAPDVQIAIQAKSAVGSAHAINQGDRAAPKTPKRAGKARARAGVAWCFQTIASVAWMISVFIYDSWTTGDQFQMLAASAWTASNLVALPDLLEHADSSKSSEASKGYM